MQLDGARCVVTGATQGIGKEIAGRLGAAGARLAVCSRSPDKVARVVDELEGNGVTVYGDSCDVGNEDDVARFHAGAREALGGIDVLVNNAGLAHFVPVAETTTEQFDETMAVNVRGVFLMSRAFLSDLIESRGHIVNVASLAGRNAVPGAAAYAAAKHAVLGFSKSMFLETRETGLRVTAICPGSVVTPFFDKAGITVDRPEHKLQPEDVADAVISVLNLPERALISELDIRPTNP